MNIFGSPCVALIVSMFCELLKAACTECVCRCVQTGQHYVSVPTDASIHVVLIPKSPQSHTSSAFYRQTNLSMFSSNVKWNDWVWDTGEYQSGPLSRGLSFYSISHPPPPHGQTLVGEQTSSSWSYCSWCESTSQTELPQWLVTL